MTGKTLVTAATPLPASWGYSVIRKVFMALSGLLLVAFVFGHWAGNTVLLRGEAAFDEYLVWLQDHPLLHYAVWVLIAAALLVHVAVGPWHWLANRRARPRRYRRKQNRATTWAARSMMISGSLLLLFLVVHIAQVRGWLTFAEGDSVYRNLVAGFTHWPILTIYLLGQVALAMHLYHGLWSQFQTLGIHHPRYNHWRRPIAAVIGIGLALLNMTLVLLNTETVMRLLEGL
jgi:succinate dehydrogenase / fumarate reductase, cytochrome b subunit